MATAFASSSTAWAIPSERGRQRLGRLGRAAALPLALLLALGAPGAEAARSWCRVDPVVRIDGQTAHIWVAAQVRNMREARQLADGEIRIVVTVPAGVDHEELGRGDNGFGDGYAVSIEESSELSSTERSVPVRVAAYVPMTDGTVRVRVSFKPVGRGRLASGRGEGTANAWIGIVAPAPDASPPIEVGP